MLTGELFAGVFIVGMLAGVFVIFMAMRQRSQQLEMQHRERMAMIERGQVPIDPAHLTHPLTSGGRSSAGSRSLSLGIIVIGIGLGFMTLVSVAGGSPEAGVGVGGAVVILGIAFIATSFVRNTIPDAPRAPRQDDLR